MGTHELIKQLDEAFVLCDQRTKDLELAARETVPNITSNHHDGEDTTSSITKS